jgi:CDP-diglyceride synthetase
MTFNPSSAFLLFPAMIVLLEVGRRLRRQRAEAVVSSTIEGAIFGLFGLLLAFTFSGAVSRFDMHRQLLTQETNDIGTAYLRLDLLPAQAQPELRQLFRDYTTSRLHLYDAVGEEISPETARLQRAIWQQATVAATSDGAKPDAAKLLLPAINEMIDITATRQNAFNMHPPEVVFWLLFVFSGGAALMAGYSMKAGPRDWMYSIALALAVTLTVYTILDVEYPRRGLIRLQQLDRTLISLRDSMKS